MTINREHEGQGDRTIQTPTSWLRLSCTCSQTVIQPCPPTNTPLSPTTPAGGPRQTPPGNGKYPPKPDTPLSGLYSCGSGDSYADNLKRLNRTDTMSSVTVTWLSAWPDPFSQKHWHAPVKEKLFHAKQSHVLKTLDRRSAYVKTVRASHVLSQSQCGWVSLISHSQCPLRHTQIPYPGE